jgi:hypothetical protein
MSELDHTRDGLMSVSYRVGTAVLLLDCMQRELELYRSDLALLPAVIAANKVCRFYCPWQRAGGAVWSLDVCSHPCMY